MSEPEKSGEKHSSIYDVPMDLPGDKKRRKLPRLSLKKLPYIITGLIVVVILVVLLGSKNDKQTPNPQSANTTTETANSSQDIPEASNSKTYDDDTIGFKVSYPSTWTLVKTADQGVRITSPTFNYQTVDGNQVNGYFRIYIRTGARSIDGKYFGRGLAVKPSEKLAYSDPLPDQRKTTLLSSFGLDSTDAFNYFLIAGNFELKKGDSLGPNYGKEAETFIVGGGYSDETQKDDLGTNPMPLDSYNKGNAYTQALEIIKSLQLR